MQFSKSLTKIKCFSPVNSTQAGEEQHNKQSSSDAQDIAGVHLRWQV